VLQKISLLFILLYFSLGLPVANAAGGPWFTWRSADDTIPYDSCHQARPVCGVNPTWYVGGTTNGGYDECIIIDPITGAPVGSCIYYCQMA